jgi:hypothetical protein
MSEVSAPPVMILVIVRIDKKINFADIRTVHHGFDPLAHAIISRYLREELSHLVLQIVTCSLPFAPV